MIVDDFAGEMFNSVKREIFSRFEPIINSSSKRLSQNLRQMWRFVWNYCFAFVLGFAIAPNNCVNGDIKLTNFELDVVRHLMKYLNSRCIVFVENDENISLLKNIKNSIGIDFYHTVVNTTFLRKVFDRNVTQWNFFHKRTAIVTKENLQLTPLLKKASSPLFVTWIVFRKYSLSKEPYIPVDSEVIFINSKSKRTFITQVYHLKPGLNETSKTMELTNLSDDKRNFLLKRPKINFEKVSMDMLVLNLKNVCHSVNGTLRKLECVHQEFLELMAARLNFSLSVVECSDKENPFTYPNGSDSVLFLKLKHREVDFSAISHIIRTRGNKYYMDFVWPTFILKSRMYLKQGRLSGRWLIFFRPLESSVWWWILGWIIASGILIQICESLLVNKLKLNFSTLLDLIYSILKSLQVFCNQSISDMSESYSIRIIYFCKLFVVLIFFQAYCGYLVSSLTVVLPRFPFNDLEGFFENPQYRLMTLQRGFHNYYFRHVVGEGRRENFILPQEELPDTIQQAVDKLCKDKHLAFSEFREDFLNFNTLSCKIAELPTPAARLHVGIAMPKGQPIKEFLRRELLQLKKTGLVKRLGEGLSTRSGYSDSVGDFTTVSMTQIFSIFILLWAGVLLSILILLIELYVGKKRSSLRGSNRKLKNRSRNAYNSHFK